MATSSSGRGSGPDATSKLPAVGEGQRGTSRTGANATGANPGGAPKSGAATFRESGAGRSASRTGGAARTARPGGADAEPRRTPRRIRLTLARLDPFSVMKLSFLIAIAIGIATVIAVAVLWNIVDAIGLWGQLDQLGKDLNGGKPLPFMEFFQFKKMVSYGVVVAFANLVIITALGTLMAFLYNIVAALLGGLKVTFTDE